MKKFKRTSKRLFNKFAEYFPYSTVDVILRNDGSFLLTKRIISPYKNKWSLPGGVVFKNERLSDAAKRIAKEELNLDVKVEKFLGVYENPISQRHDISHVFIVSIVRGKVTLDFQSSAIKFFNRPPKNMICFQRRLIIDARQFLK